MKLSSLFLAVPAALFVLGSGAASAGEAISDAGAFACVADKWAETEPEKAHKWVDYVGRCVGIPDAPAAPKYTEDCVGKFEYMPDGSWKGSGTCTFNFKGGDKMYGSFEEGSHLKEAIYKITGGTGIFEGASGSGTYTYEKLTGRRLRSGRSGVSSCHSFFRLPLLPRLRRALIVVCPAELLSPSSLCVT